MTDAIAERTSTSHEEAAETNASPAASRGCSLCGNTGHYRSTCPRRTTPRGPATHSHAALLLAAAAKLSARLPVFSTEDLAVAAHLLHPSAFALQGFPEHPDHVKIRVRVFGKAGLVGQGYFERVKGGLRLTAEGRVVAASLHVAAETVEAPATPRRRKRIVRRLRRRVRLPKLRGRHIVTGARPALATSLAMQKRIAIERVLAETRFNMRRAAQILDVSRSNLYALVKSYGIDVSAARRESHAPLAPPRAEPAPTSRPPQPPPPVAAPVPPPAPPPIDHGPLTEREARVVYALSRTVLSLRYLRGEVTQFTQDDANGFWAAAEGYDPARLTALLERAQTHYDRRLPSIGVVQKLASLHAQLVACRFRAWNRRFTGG